MTRLRVTFWALVATAAAATGILSKALAASASPATGITVAIAATTLVVTLLLALRILVKVDPINRSDREESP